jgi:hypothetical protein
LSLTVPPRTKSVSSTCGCVVVGEKLPGGFEVPLETGVDVRRLVDVEVALAVEVVLEVATSTAVEVAWLRARD